MQSAFDVRPIAGSVIALETPVVDTGASITLGHDTADTLLYVARGTGRLEVDTAAEVAARSAGLLLAGEKGTLTAEDQLDLVLATVGTEADRHAPMGPLERVTSLRSCDAQTATGARSFQILFGPHNGSTRATLFAGFIPPGRAPWHYHLYDEIVWVPEGPGRLHLEGGDAHLEGGSAFRLRPRQVHIVENPSDSEMTIIGVFTPAGSPSAAYLTADVAAVYSFAD